MLGQMRLGIPIKTGTIGTVGVEGGNIKESLWCFLWRPIKTKNRVVTHSVTEG